MAFNHLLPHNMPTLENEYGVQGGIHTCFDQAEAEGTSTIMYKKQSHRRYGVLPSGKG